MLWHHSPSIIQAEEKESSTVPSNFFSRRWWGHFISIQVSCMYRPSGIFSAGAGEAATKLWRIQLVCWTNGLVIEWMYVSTRWQRCFLHYIVPRSRVQPQLYSIWISDSIEAAYTCIRLIQNLLHDSHACHFNSTAEPCTRMHACMHTHSYIRILEIYRNKSQKRN